MIRVAIVDDGMDLYAALPHLLGSRHDLSLASPVAPGMFADVSADVVFVNLDAWCSNADAILGEVVGRISAPVIGLTAALSFERIREGFRAGAYDVIGLPPRACEIQDALLRALAVGRHSPGAVADTEPSGLLGVSSAMERLRADIACVAAAPVPVLIQGESGVGKELVARAIHDLSDRSDCAFEARNCGALPEHLFEAEIFGTERGAYTGACERKGACELADGGTLFLDEVGELIPAHQVKLLRLVENGVYHRVGNARERRANLRFISASNRNLAEAVQRGDFRSDLFYRLCVVPITIPPLRERPDDIPLLARHFAKQGLGPAGHAHPSSPGGVALEVDNGALEKLSHHSWPGNVRELRNVMQRAVLRAEPPVVRSCDIWFA